MRWYNDQSASSRNFRTVEHRRDKNGPFYHEFLLLKLTDGAICRLECVGEGSRTDAIRYIGCAANDLMQWFNAGDYAKFESDNPSELLSEVMFPFEYDMLDVLAICYSIQNTQACKVYTLQRYNCYFLCLTVLAVLTRRAAGWENEVTDLVWDSALDSELARLSNLPAQEVKETLLLRLGAMLDPYDPHCSELLLKELRSQLDSGSLIAREMPEAVRSALWVSPWELEPLTESIASCISPLVTDDKFSAVQICRILIDSLLDSNPRLPSNKSLIDLCTEELNNQMHRSLFRRSHIFSTFCHLMENEQRISFGKRMLCRIIQCYLIVVSAITTSNIGIKVRRITGVGVGYPPFDNSLNLNLTKLFSGPFGYGVALVTLTGDRYKKVIKAAMDLPSENYYTPAMISTLNTLESKGMLEREDDVRILLAFVIIRSKPHFPGHGFVVSTLLSTLRVIFEGQSAHMGLKLRDDSSVVPEITRTLEFQQQYIQPRIHAHAERVALHRLAPAPLVRMDIHNTMAAVWKSLPLGFGGADRTSSGGSSR